MDLNNEFGFEDKPFKNSRKQRGLTKSKSNIGTLQEMYRIENSFQSSGIFVPNENMLDGFQKLTLKKYL